MRLIRFGFALLLASALSLTANAEAPAVQPFGLTQSMVRIGTRWVALGIGEWAKSPVGLVKRVHEKSDFMRLRAKTQQRELNEIQSVVKGKSAMRAKMDALMFMPMTSPFESINGPPLLPGLMAASV